MFSYETHSINLRSSDTHSIVIPRVNTTKYGPLSLSYYGSQLWNSLPNTTRGPFLERPGNLTGPKSYFEIKFSRKVGCVLTSNEVHFVSLADNFTV